jgi:FlaA1/EpsC-like NDP-sugar epimerase
LRWGVLFFGFYLGEVNIYEARKPPPGNTIINALTDFAYKRHVFEMLLDLVRYDGAPAGEQLAIFTKTLLPVMVVQMLCFLVWGVYRGLWHYVGMHDLLVMVQAVGTGAVVNSLVVLAMYGFRGPSRGVRRKTL